SQNPEARRPVGLATETMQRTGPASWLLGLQRLSSPARQLILAFPTWFKDVRCVQAVETPTMILRASVRHTECVFERSERESTTRRHQSIAAKLATAFEHRNLFLRNELQGAVSPSGRT